MIVRRAGESRDIKTLGIKILGMYIYIVHYYLSRQIERAGRNLIISNLSGNWLIINETEPFFSLIIFKPRKRREGGQLYNYELRPEVRYST